MARILVFASCSKHRHIDYLCTLSNFCIYISRLFIQVAYCHHCIAVLPLNFDEFYEEFCKFFGFFSEKDFSSRKSKKEDRKNPSRVVLYILSGNIVTILYKCVIFASERRAHILCYIFKRSNLPILLQGDNSCCNEDLSIL